MVADFSVPRATQRGTVAGEELGELVHDPSERVEAYLARLLPRLALPQRELGLQWRAARAEWKDGGRGVQSASAALSKRRKQQVPALSV